MDTDSDGTLDAKFWLTVIGAVVACCIGALIVFLLLGMAWEAWGALITLIVAIVVVVGIAALVDRARTKRYEEAGV